MVIECSPYSQRGTERSNPQSEAREDETVSRNASEPDSASLVINESGQPPVMGEACHHWQRNIRMQPVGSPGCLWAACSEREAEEPERPDQTGRESDTFIVVKKGLINLERREVTVGA